MKVLLNLFFVIVVVLDFWKIATAEMSNIQETAPADHVSTGISYKNVIVSKTPIAVEKSLKKIQEES